MKHVLLKGNSMSLLLGFLKGIIARKKTHQPEDATDTTFTSISSADLSSNTSMHSTDTKAGGSTLPPTLSPSVASRIFLDCIKILLLREKHANAIACMLDAIRHDRQTLCAQSDQLQTSGDELVSACLRACSSVAAATDMPERFDTFISVIICSIDDRRFQAVRAEYERELAGGAFEIIRIADARSLAEGYNRGLTQSSGNIVIFSHDDIRLLSPGFRRELEASLNEFDIVGVAGSTLLAGPTWFSCAHAHRRQLVCYPPDSIGTSDHACHIDGPQDVRWHPGIQCLDGLFFAAHRASIGNLRFDEQRYDGFHFYDLDFTYRAFLSDLRLGVCPRLCISHASAGKYDSDKWHRYAEIFCSQYDLPMHSLPTTRPIQFKDETRLREFLSAYFSWQDKLPSLPSPLAKPNGERQHVLLHVGCGSLNMTSAGPGFQIGGWREVRLDADPSVQPDLLGSITDMSAVPDHSVDAVFSSHTLEHLYLHEVPRALAEIHRVLKPEGFTLSWVPDLQAAARWIAEDRLFEPLSTSPYGSITPFDMVFSHRDLVGRDKPYMAHHCGFTQSTLADAHHQAGFPSVIALSRIQGFDLQVIASPSVMPYGLFYALACAYFQD